MTKQHFKSFDYPPHHRWPTHSTTCDETALQVLWLPTALLLIDPLDYLWRNCTSSPLTTHRTTADQPTRLPVTKLHFKSFDSPPHYRWLTHSTTCDETALQVLWLPTAPPLTNPLDYLWRNCTSSPLTPHRTTFDRPTQLPVTKQHFESFDFPAHYCWLTHSTTYDETALQVIWLPTTLPPTDPLDYLWRNSTSSPLTTHRTTADQPTRLPVTKLHFKSFDSPSHYCWLTHSTTCDETALQVLWLPTALLLIDPLDYLWRNSTSSPLTTHRTTADQPTRLPVTKLHFQVLWLPTALLLIDPLDYLWRNCTSSPLTPHGTTADGHTRLPVTKLHFKSFDSPRHYCWSTHSTTCDETALQVLWLPTAPPLTNPTTTCDETALQVLWLPTALLLIDPLDYLWRNCTSSPLTPHGTTADRPTRLPVTKQLFKSFDYPPHHRWPTHSTTCDETALQVLWLPTALLLIDPLDYLWRNCTSSPLTTHRTTADQPTRLPVTKLHFKSFDSPPHYLWPTHSTTCDKTALRVLWLSSALLLTDPLNYIWRNSTSSHLTPNHTTADWPTRLLVTKQHFKSFDYPPHHHWPTHSTTCDKTALRVLWLPSALLLTDPLDNIWRNSTSSPLTPNQTTADWPTRLLVTKLHFKSFDFPSHYLWATHSTTCDKTALQVLWLPSALLLTDPLDYLWRNSTSSPLTPHGTTADRPTRLPVTKLHFKSFDFPPHYLWATFSTTCDKTALQVLWLPSALLLTDPLDYLLRNSTSSPLTPHGTTADRPTRLPVTKQHFKSFDSPPYHCWPTHLTTCDETALQVLWLPTTLPLTDPLDYLWRNSTSSPLTPHGTTADRPTRLPVTKQHFKSFDSPPYHRWPTHLTTCDETALQVLWLPTTLPLTDPLDYLWRNSTSSPLTTHRTTADQPTRLTVTKLHFKSFDSPRHYCWWPTRLPVTKQHFKSFDYQPHHRWPTHSTTCDETALQVLWLPTALLLIDPLDYLWRNSTSSPLTTHRTTADRPTSLPVTKQHFKSFDYPPHHRWPTHSTTCDETALQVLWLPTALLLTNPLDYLWRNCTSSPLTPHGTTADGPTRLPVTKLHFKSFDSPPHYLWPTHSTTCDKTALRVLWLSSALLLTDPLDYIWRNSTSSHLTPNHTTADWPTRLLVTKQHFKSFDYPPHHHWPTHSTTCDKTALRVLWLPSALLLTDPLDNIWRNSTSSPLTPNHTTADWPTRLLVTKLHFKSFDFPPHYLWATHSTTCDKTALQVLWLPSALLLTDPLDYLWRNSTSSPLTPHGTTADRPTRLPVTKLHFKSFDFPPHYLWATFSTTCDKTALQVLWLPSALLLTDPLDYLWRNSTSSPLTLHLTTADRPTWLPVTKQHFKSFDSPPHYRWLTHSTTCDETALQVLWLPTALLLIDPLDYLWRNSTSSPLTPHLTTADRPTWLPVTKQHIKSFDSPPHYRWPTHSTTCDETALQVLWLPTAPLLTNPLD